MHILAIETSCDETAAAMVEKNGSDVRIFSNVISSQVDLHRKFGGIFPEHASRAHCEKIIPVVEETLRVTSNKKQDIDLIAVTTGPGLIGSLLVGVNFAKTYAYAKNLPIIGINHWLGHIYSCFSPSEPSILKANRGGERHGQRAERLDPKFSLGISRSVSLSDTGEQIPQFPSLILIVSGGHTGLVLMKSHNNMITLGETLDDAAGEAFDKVAKLLELGYPGGPAISKAAGKYQKLHYNRDRAYGGFLENDIKLPRSMLDRKDFNFSFSGLKTAVLYQVKELQSVTYNLSPITSAAVAAEFQQTVIDILVGKTIQAAYKYHPKSICLCGGVSANKELRQQLKKAVSGLPWKCSYHIPPMELTTDNAAMIGIAAAYHLDQKTSWQNINANANLRL